MAHREDHVDLENSLRQGFLAREPAFVPTFTEAPPVSIPKPISIPKQAMPFPTVAPVVPIPAAKILTFTPPVYKPPADLKFNLPVFDPSKPAQYAQTLLNPLARIGRSALALQVSAAANEENPAVRQMLNRGSMQEFGNYMAKAATAAGQFGLSVYKFEYGAQLVKAEKEFDFLEKSLFAEASFNFTAELTAKKTEYDAQINAQENALNRAQQAALQNNTNAYKQAVEEFKSAESRAAQARKEAHEATLQELVNQTRITVARLGGRTTAQDFGSAAGGIGSLITAGIAIAKFCWVAAELYGKDTEKFFLARYWIMFGWKGRIADITRKIYLRYGKKFAAFLKQHQWLKSATRPIFDIAVYYGRKSLRDNIIVNGEENGRLYI